MYRQPFPTDQELDELYAMPAYAGVEPFHSQIDSDSPDVRLFDRALDWLARVAAEEGFTPETLLEIGCGTGTFLRMARRRGWAVEGVESSVDIAARARDEFELDIADGNFLQAVLRRDQYDVIAMWETLEHARDPDAVLARAKRLLAPGGRLLIFTIDSSSLFNSIAHAAHAVTFGAFSGPLDLLYDTPRNFYFNERSLGALTSTAGFGVGHVDRRRAYVGRRPHAPMPAWIRVAGGIVDVFSVFVGRQYRQLLYCRPVA
jgi:SAM-dependent methyltransferase